MIFRSFGAAVVRPANVTAYASGQLVANSTTAGSVVPIQIDLGSNRGGPVRLARAFVSKSGPVLTNAAFRLHIYDTLPVPAFGDGGAWQTALSGIYIGSFDLTMIRAFGNGALGIGVPTEGTSVYFVPKDNSVNSNRIWALLEARGAYTPVSAESFTAGVEGITESAV